MHGSKPKLNPGDLHVGRRGDCVGVHQIGVELEGFLALLFRKEISHCLHGFGGHCHYDRVWYDNNELVEMKEIKSSSSGGCRSAALLAKKK